MSELIGQLVWGVGQGKQKVKVVAFLLFLLFVLLALVRPQMGTKLETVRRTGVDVVITARARTSREAWIRKMWSRGALKRRSMRFAC